MSQSSSPYDPTPEEDVETALSPLLGMDDEGETEAFTPSLPTIRSQQRELLARLREGFASRREILLWQHAVSVVTVGMVPDGWFREIISDKYRTAALLADEPKRERMCKHPPSDEGAAGERDDIQQEVLAPAFQAARKEINEQAGDYTDDDEGIAGTDEQRYLAMRPRVHQLAREQHDAIRWALGATDHPALENRRHILDWADYIDYATRGYLPDGFVEEVTNPLGDWWGALIDPNPGAYLESLLAADVLPASNAALRDAMRHAEEKPEQENRSTRDPSAKRGY